jgi:hypothetical protein
MWYIHSTFVATLSIFQVSYFEMPSAVSNMKQQLLLYLFILASTLPACGQINEHNCMCPKNTMTGTLEGAKADATFSFNNGHKIILCGYRNNNQVEISYSEFILQVCGYDDIIDFWGATQTCRLFVDTDTLKVVDIVNLPTGVNRSYKPTDWSVEKIYFVKGQLARAFEVNRSIRKYTQHEISSTLVEFETAKGDIDDNKLRLINRLFIAAISGDKKARKYFKESESKFGELDGAFAEEYKDLKAMLNLWQEQSRR